VDQTVVSDETVVAGDWAFDRGRAHRTLTPVAGGDTIEVDSEVVVILRRQADGAWKVARTIGVLR